MEILIIGSGLVGAALGELAGPARAVVTRSADADIRDRQQVRTIVGHHRPQWIVLSAAISDVDDSERNPGLAWDVNVGGTRNVAEAAKDAGARLMYISTDYVFDGEREGLWEADAPRNPVNYYGKTKAEAEDTARQIIPNTTIVRPSWVLGVQRLSFAEKMLIDAAAKGELTLPNDKFSSPTYNRDLAKILLTLIDRSESGVFQACNTGATSRYGIAQVLLREAGLEGVVLKESPPGAQVTFARRPRSTPMSTKSLEKIGLTMRPWQEAARDFVAELRALGRLPVRAF